MKTYTGACHCGAVAFSAEAEKEIVEAMECNCSHCQRKGLLLVFLPAERMRVTDGEEALVSYQFGGKSIDHLFCKMCGVQPIGRGVSGQASGMSAVNVRCLEGLAIESLTRTPFNGRDL